LLFTKINENSFLTEAGRIDLPDNDVQKHLHKRNEYKMGKLEGKIALVGGNLGKIKKEKFKMGLGGAIAKQLKDDGAQVIIFDLDYKISEACATAIGGSIKAMECDIMKDREYRTEPYIDHRGNEKTNVIWTDNPALKMVESIVQEFGRIDIVVSNFDRFEKARLDSTTVELFDTIRDYNITPMFHLLAAVREQLSKQTKADGTFAKIVLMTSMVGKAGMSIGTIYAAFKAGTVALTKSLGKEFGRFANVNGVAIGPLAEKKMQGPREKIKSAFMVTQTAMGSLPTTFAKITPLVGFLASDGAVGINGQIISVDGGLWLKLEQ